MILTGEDRITLRKTCPSDTLFTTNPTWTDPGAEDALCSPTEIYVSEVLSAAIIRVASSPGAEVWLAVPDKAESWRT
jgi:hypothetical protein